MPRRAMVETGAGYIAEPGPIEAIDGKLTDQSVAALAVFVQQVTKALNGNLSMGDGTRNGRAGNFDSQVIEHYFKTANVAEQLPHSLGRKPAGYFVIRRSKAGDLYDDLSNAWTSEALWLKSDTADITVALVVF